MYDYQVTIHYTDKVGARQTFITEKVANSGSDAEARAVELFEYFGNKTESIIEIDVERIG